MEKLHNFEFARIVRWAMGVLLFGKLFSKREAASKIESCEEENEPVAAARLLQPVGNFGVL